MQSFWQESLNDFWQRRPAYFEGEEWEDKDCPISSVDRWTGLQIGEEKWRIRDMERVVGRSRPQENCPFECYHDAFFVRGSVLKSLTRIERHEAMLQKGLLHRVDRFEKFVLKEQHDTIDQEGGGDTDNVEFIIFCPVVVDKEGTELYLKPWKRTIFVSHRWLDPRGDPPHPDDVSNSKLRMLQTQMKDDDYVMLDFMSFPQDSDPSPCIKSLPWFVYHVSHFIVLCKTGKDFYEYLDRGWCQVELLAAFFPVLTSKETKSYFEMGNYDDSDRRHYCFASLQRQLVITHPSTSNPPNDLMFSHIHPPVKSTFTDPEDADKTQFLVDAAIPSMQKAFPQSRTHKEEHSFSKGNYSIIEETTTFDDLGANANQDLNDMLIKFGAVPVTKDET